MVAPLHRWMGFLVFHIALTVQAQPMVQWQRCYGGTDEEGGFSVCQTTDGGYILGGETYSNDLFVSGNHSNVRDLWVVRLDAGGDTLWQRCLGGSDMESGTEIIPISDGGYLLAGSSSSTDGDVIGNHGASDIWVVKLDAEGELLWQKSLGGSSEDWPTAIRQTTDGGYVVIGYSFSNDGDVSGSHGSQDIWVVKLYADGEIQWQSALGGSSGEWPYCIEQTADGGYILAGDTNSDDGDVSWNYNTNTYDAWVVKLDAGGELEWDRPLGGQSFDDLYAILQTADGDYVAAGSTRSDDGDVTGDHSSTDMWLLKLSAGGGITWQAYAGGTGREEAWALDQTEDGGFLVAGHTRSSDGDVTGYHGGTDLWVVKFSGNGSLQWQGCLGGTGDEVGTDLDVTADGGAVIVGGTNSTDGDIVGNNGASDMLLFKLASDQVGIAEYQVASVHIAPDPVIDHLWIDVPATAAFSSFTITDMHGRLVLRSLWRGSPVDVQTLGPGVYRLTLYDGSGRPVIGGSFVKR